MPGSRYLIILTLFFQFFFSGIQAQIWPGDITDNGEVNAVDVLYWALANGNDGIPRATSSFLWQEQLAGEDWTESFPDGQNYAFADCNGDGLINLIDLIVIQLNQDSSKTPYLGEDFSFGIKGIDPEIWLGEVEGQTIESVLGSEINIPINIGTAERPALDFAGIAFKIYIDTALIGPIEPVIEQSPDDWLENESGIVLLNMDQQFQQEGTIGKEVAFYLFNPDANTLGFGQIGQLRFIIEDDLTFIGTDTTITVVVEPTRMMDSDLTTLDLAGDTLEITIFQDSISMLNTTQVQRKAVEQTLTVFPNPSSNTLTIAQEDHKLSSIAIYDALNKMVYQEQLDQYANQLSLDIQQLPPGVYWLSALTQKNQRLQSKFIKIDY